MVEKSILGVQEFHIQKLHDLFLGNGSVGINIHRHTDHIHPMPLWEQNPTNSLGCSFRHEKWPWSSTTHDECRLLLRFYQQKSYSWWCFNTATSDDFYQRYGLHKKNAYKHLDTTSVTQECVISVCVCQTLYLREFSYCFAGWHSNKKFCMPNSKTGGKVISFLPVDTLTVVLFVSRADWKSSFTGVFCP